MIRFEIRPLISLPWASRLGKMSEYPDLEHRMRRLMGDDWWNQEANRIAFETNPQYRDIVVTELRKAPWAPGIFKGVDRATNLARQSPLIGKHLGDTAEAQWHDWKKTLGDLRYPEKEWLRWLPRVISGDFDDGRHRITYLRAHRDPDHPVLVQVHH
ncbi:transcriptional regulator [Mycolicibacterium fortuitum]|uniref:transcriptional regulator n=1 Tax=Mycolicibacterium fortuitum TaxID=1766 RepID=UPI00260752C3|nr:transcriptional regulator [Mycolicibacterium fortuitum]